MKKDQTLPKRVIVSVCILSIIYSSIIYASLPLYIFLNALVIGITLFEFFNITEQSGLRPRKTLGISLGVLFPLFMYFPGEPIVFGAAIMALMFLNFNEETEKFGGLINTAATLFGLVYVGLFLSYFTKLRCLPHGAAWVCYIITITKLCDAGAYFVGTSFGKTKPFKKISPNKSLEGIIGGFIFSILGSFAFKVFLHDIEMAHLFILGFLLAIIGPLGDLTESLIKRECQVKDSGAVPGLGGALDILDSLLFTVPFLYYYLQAFIIG